MSELKVDTQIPAPSSGVYKFVDYSDLETFTSIGWKLVSVFQEKSVVPFFDSVPNPHPKAEHDYNYSDTIQTQTNLEETNTKFLLVFDEKSKLQEYKDDAITARQALNEKIEEVESLREELSQNKSSTKRFEVDLQSSRDDFAHLEKRHREQLRIRQQLEEDLAKVRAHVGKASFDEALRVDG